MVAQRKQPEPPRNTILHGDALETLRRLPDGCVQTIVTSPPYYGLRDYGTKGQIGLEATPAEYVATLVRLFREAGRVLRRDGTLWVNLGDTYANDTKWGGKSSNKNMTSIAGGYDTARGRRINSGLTPKSLIGIPWRVAFGLQDDGWTLRSDIIWAKENCTPESVKDRPTKMHEYIFLFSKSSSYFYDANAIRDPIKDGTIKREQRGYAHAFKSQHAGSPIDTRHQDGKKLNRVTDPAGRNARTVWNIPTSPYPEAHFATFPTELPRRCILAGSRPGDLVLDPFAGAGTTLLMAQRLGRDYLGIELNGDYIRMAQERMLRDTLPPAMKQTNLTKHIPVRLFDEGL